MSEEDMTKIKVTEAFTYGGDTLEPGKTVDLPNSAAESAVQKGYGEKVEEEKEVPEIKEAESSDKASEGDVTNIENYVKSGGWLTASEVEEGDHLIIKGDPRFDERFDQRYLVITVEYNEQEYNLRVGKRNTKRISEEYGKDATEWASKKLEVAAIQKYEGVNAKGMILKPVTD